MSHSHPDFMLGFGGGVADRTGDRYLQSSYSGPAPSRHYIHGLVSPTVAL